MTRVLNAAGGGAEAGVAWKRVESADQLKVGDVVKEGRRWALDDEPGDFEGFVGRVHAVDETIVSEFDEAKGPIKTVVKRSGSFLIQLIEPDGSPGGIHAFTDIELGIVPYPTYEVPTVPDPETGTTGMITVRAEGNRYLDVMAVAVGRPALSDAA